MRNLNTGISIPEFIQVSKPADKFRSLILSGVWARPRHFGELVYRKAGIDRPSSITLLSGSEAPFQ